MPSNSPIPYALDDVVVEKTPILTQGYLRHKNSVEASPGSKEIKEEFKHPKEDSESLPTAPI